ncbi:hypothetical protein HDU87_002334 [Geranomyces variabilis]|uniref:Uncharacterized protein n=1 Tax=Geranomyces variabilis TaxID=109894 RepID=A0AAD5TLE9_9FUNG|nr:hypothetical protein HDU87_002334 [Geranomyces variabilis]
MPEINEIRRMKAFTDVFFAYLSTTSRPQTFFELRQHPGLPHVARAFVDILDEQPQHEIPVLLAHPRHLLFQFKRFSLIWTPLTHSAVQAFPRGLYEEAEASQIAATLNKEKGRPFFIELALVTDEWVYCLLSADRLYHLNLLPPGASFPCDFGIDISVNYPAWINALRRYTSQHHLRSKIIHTELISNQQIWAGCGNYTASEILHAAGLDPFTPAATVYADAQLLGRLAEAFHTFATQELDLAKKFHGPMIAARDQLIREWQECISLDTGIDAYLAEIERSYQPDELSDFSLAPYQPDALARGTTDTDTNNMRAEKEKEVEEAEEREDDREDDEDMDISELYLHQEYSNHAGPTHAAHHAKLVPVYCYSHKKDKHRFYTVFQHPYKKPKNFISLNDVVKKTKKLYGVGMYEFIGLLQETRHKGRPPEGRNIREAGHSAAWKKQYELVTMSSHVSK